MIIGSNIIHHETLSSTNTEARLLLKSSDQPEGTVICTDFQTSGRGQAGNTWISARGKNLLFSVILYPASVMPDEQFLISMSLSLGICDFMNRYYRDCRIKWPNDILADNDKIAGMLIENSVMGAQIENTVAGIGLNINQDDFNGIQPLPVSLKMITGREYDLDECLKEVLSDLDLRYKQLLYGDRKVIVSDYMARLFRYREWYLYESGGMTFTGRIKDVLISGHILIEEKNGETRKFSFKEFRYLS